jgi:hypothetical protein
VSIGSLIKYPNITDYRYLKDMLTLSNTNLFVIIFLWLNFRWPLAVRSRANRKIRVRHIDSSH